MENKEYYNNIFEEYKELKMKTFTPVSDVILGRKIVGVHIKHEDLFRRDEVREELRKGLEFLSDEQLQFLYNDDDSDLVTSVIDVLVERKLGGKDIKIIKDLKIALKDFESTIKNNFIELLIGRDLENFSLRPREIWANLLLCIALSEINGKDITFAEDKKGDGLIIVKDTFEVIPTEHVSALENEHNPQPKGEDRIINAINKKIKKCEDCARKGVDYAKGKWLVVFFDGAEKFYRNKIRESIKGRHNFGSVFCVGLLTIQNGVYSYIVTEFRDSYGDQSKSFKIDINSDFTDWKIEQIKE